MEDSTSKGALSVRLAHDLVMEAFPLKTAKYGMNDMGMRTQEMVDGPFWTGVDRSDEEAVKKRLLAMGRLIGDLALRIEGRP